MASRALRRLALLAVHCICAAAWLAHGSPSLPLSDDLYAQTIASPVPLPAGALALAPAAGENCTRVASDRAQANRRRSSWWPWLRPTRARESRRANCF